MSDTGDTDPLSSGVGRSESGDPAEVHAGTHTAKRRASRAGSRTVASLNASQLARKRANDREAQRAIRQRTKEHISRLEDRIRTLGGEHEDAALEGAWQRNEELEFELRQLQEGIRPEYVASPNAIVQSGEYGSHVHSQHSSPWLLPQASSLPHASITGSLDHFNLDAWSSSTLSQTSPLDARSPITAISSRDFSRTGGPSLPVLNLARNPTFPLELGQLNIHNSAHENTSPTGTSSQTQQTITPNSLARPILRRIMSTPTQPPFHPQTSLLQRAWELPLRLVPPTGPVDHIWIGVIQSQRRANPPSISFISSKPILNTLIDPNSSPAPPSLSSIIIDLLHRTALPGLAEKAACLIVLYDLIRWLIYPSEATYSAMPDWYVPRTSQHLSAHPIWVSTIAWGKLRDRVIGYQVQYATEEFQHLYTKSLNLNWPYRPVDILHFDGDAIRASEVFEAHARKLENWSLGAPFAMRYPELEGFCRFSYAPMDGGG